MQNINRQMAGWLALKVVGLVIMSVVLGGAVMPVVSAELASEPGEWCSVEEDDISTTCSEVPPKGFYTCRKGKSASPYGTCVCRWGKLEAGWHTIFNWSGNEEEVIDDICLLVKKWGGIENRGATAVMLGIVQVLISFVTALTVMAGLVIFVASGYVYMTAGGDASRVQKAKVWMGSSIAGIALALLGFTILRLIATNLVSF